MNSSHKALSSQAQRKTTPRESTNVTTVSRHTDLSPPVMAILNAFYISADSKRTHVIAKPLAVSNSRSSDTYSQEEKNFADNLAACQSSLSKMARGMCKSYSLPDPEDIVQMAMMKAWQDRKTLDQGNIEAWTKQILKHRVYDELRKRRTRRVVFDESAEVERQFDKADENLNPHAVLQILQERIFPHIRIELRDVLTLRALGYTIDEAGEFLGLTRNAVHKREVRARKLITELFSSGFQGTVQGKPDRPGQISAKAERPKHS